MTTDLLTKFNNKLQDFTTELIETYEDSLGQEFTDYYRNITLDSNEYIERFYTHMKESYVMLYKENLDLLKRPFFKFINLSDLSLNTGSLFSIFRYFKHMYIYAFKYYYEKDINDLIRTTKEERASLSNGERYFLKIISSLRQNKESAIVNLEKQLGQTEEDELENGENSFEDEVKNSFKNFGLPGTDQLLGGGIGKLAMDIAKDINVDDLNIGNPAELLSGLMSGKMDQNSGIMGLFGKITNKIHSKLNSGEVDTSMLQKEAQQVMNNKEHPINKMSSMMHKMNPSNPDKNINSEENLSEMMKSVGSVLSNQTCEMTTEQCTENSCEVTEQLEQLEQPEQPEQPEQTEQKPSREDLKKRLNQLKQLKQLKRQLNQKKI